MKQGTRRLRADLGCTLENEQCSYSTSSIKIGGQKDYCILQNEVQSVLPKIITTGFRAIRLIYFFTAGEDEVKCWQIRKGAKAPQVRFFFSKLSSAGAKVPHFPPILSFVWLQKLTANTNDASH